MGYLRTAFAQMHFAWKLWDAADDGKIALESVDADISFQSDDGKIFYKPPSAIFENAADFINAFENLASIGFGVAAIALNRACEEQGLGKPDPIASELDQCVALIYQIRCAFAHDIAAPKWQIKTRYRRSYTFGDRTFDLATLDGKSLKWEHMGGPDGLVWIKEFLTDNVPNFG